MLFNSVEFLFFLPIVLLVYYCLNLRGQNIWLLLASYFFYGWWDYRFLSLLIVSTIVDYFCGQGIKKTESTRKKRIYVLISILTNLSILGFFKYFNFFVESATNVLNLLGMEPSFLVIEILLPMGISFYTFQTMAYTIDVYRGRIEPTSSFFNFALYVSYFPQLVAGPIERAEHLLPQLESRRRVDSKMISNGLILILLGFFKKVAVADVVAQVVNQVFAEPGQFSAFTLLLGVYLFAIQIYCDFSGYTDIARGTSLLIGINLIENFQHPYFASSITDFWRRWHISLSAWLRDYLYIPLGGNRGGRFNTYRNLMITMLLGGLWHGASWNFVIWGGLHGTYLSLHKLMNASRSSWEGRKKTRVWKQVELLKKNLDEKPATLTAGIRKVPDLFAQGHYALNCFFTFHLVCLAWIFFRADNFTTSLSYLEGLSRVSIPASLGVDIWSVLRTALPICMLLFIEIAQFTQRDHTFFRSWRTHWQALFFLAIFLCIFIFGAFDEEVPFIYFQF